MGDEFDTDKGKSTGSLQRLGLKHINPDSLLMSQQKLYLKETFNNVWINYLKDEAYSTDAESICLI